MIMPVINVDKITKEYRLGQLRSLKDSVLENIGKLTGKQVTHRRKLIALDNISFTIEKGEVIGIIGTNGAGKSTLLKILSNITTPTSGTFHVDGTIAPLIEVGAGLNPELTGRENIILNGAILGIPRKVISGQIDNISSFAELTDFIDTPVKRYSSGMMVRLGFSIATMMDADILIVDEVLAVGDLAFQRKCFDRMEQMIKHQGKTVILVSHNIRQVQRMCTRVLLIDRGRIIADGSPTDVSELFFHRSNKKIADDAHTSVTSRRPVQKTGEVELDSIKLLNEEGKSVNEVTTGQPVTIRGIFHTDSPIERPEIIFGFHTTDFFYISSMGTAHIEERPDLLPGKNIIDCHIPGLPLVPGVYCIRCSVSDKYRRAMFDGDMLLVFTVTSESLKVTKLSSYGMVYISAKWSFPHQRPDPVTSDT